MYERALFTIDGRLRVPFTGVLVAGSLLALGCAAEVQAEPGPEAVDQKSHAVVRIQRESLDTGEEQGDALAGFLSLPKNADPEAILSLVGLSEAVPPLGRCQLGREITTANSEVPELTLLEVEAVDLRTPRGPHELAPNVFPTVADWLRGVVYASRDRDASTLPSSVPYAISAKNSDGTLVWKGEFLSPPFPEDVTVGGVPLAREANAETPTLSQGGPVDLSWKPSDVDSADTLWIVFGGSFGTFECAFPDKDGAASFLLPPRLTSREEEITASIHRLRRSSEEPGDGRPGLEMRFDFSRIAHLTLE